MAGMVHAACSAVNGMCHPAIQTAPMPSDWEHIRAAIAQIPGQEGREAVWLAEKIGVKRVQNVANWRTRGVPADQWEAIADALGWTLDEVAGRKPPPNNPWPFADLIPRARFDDLSPAQQVVVGEAVRKAVIDAENAAKELASWKRRGNGK